MDEKTFLFIIAVYSVIFVIVHVGKKLVIKFRGRDRYYFERSFWKQRLISAITSFVLTIGVIVYVFRFNIQETLFGSIFLKPGDIFISLVIILITCGAYIYGNRKGEKLAKGLKPIIRENVFASICNHPYRTLRQAYTAPSFSRPPTEHEILEWREESRDYASNKAMLISAYLLYILVLVEVFVGIIFFVALSGGLSFEIFVTIFSIEYSAYIEFFKYIGMMLTLGFVGYSLLSIIFHIPIIRIIELVGRMLNVGDSKSEEWTKFIIHSIIFNIFIIVLIRLVANA